MANNVDSVIANEALQQTSAPPCSPRLFIYFSAPLQLATKRLAIKSFLEIFWSHIFLSFLSLYEKKHPCLRSSLLKQPVSLQVNPPVLAPDANLDQWLQLPELFARVTSSCKWAISGQTHEFKICYHKKQIDVSFKCDCPVIDHEFRHNIVKVVCIFTRLSPRGSTATLTMWWRNSWSITGQTHKKLMSVC